MFLDQPAQIMAQIRSGRVIDIGEGKIKIKMKTKTSTTHSGTYTIQIAFAFAATYIVWGSTYLAIRYAVETIPPLVTAGIRHTIAGSVMLAWAYARGYRPT